MTDPNMLKLDFGHPTCVIELEAERWAKLMEALNYLRTENPGLRTLLARNPSWELLRPSSGTTGALD